MPELLDHLRQQLAALDEHSLRRRRRIVESPQGPELTLDGRRYLSFCSNDYLGLANHPRVCEALQAGVARYGAGAGASALISGHSRAAEQLEQRLAQFTGLPRALYFATGYMANLGIIPALAGPGDVVFSDRLNHACLIDGTRLSGAKLRIYPHTDLDRLEKLLRQSRSGRRWIITDAVFSMDGDLAPLPRLARLCEQYDAWLLVDDAHGFGVLGPQGRGSLAHFGLQSRRIVYMATLGKAAGVAGAFVAGEPLFIEWLLQRARTYVFTTAAPPALAGALLAALDLIEQEDWRRQHLQRLIARLHAACASLPWRLLPSQSAVQALLVGDNQRALDLMTGLQQRGIWVPAIRPPTVPRGTARLRVSLSAAHGLEQVDQLGDALRELA